MLHEVAIMMMLITRGESEPDTGSVLELDDGALQTLHGRRAEQESDQRAADTAMVSSRN